jgi:hypothetical protein
MEFQSWLATKYTEEEIVNVESTCHANRQQPHHLQMFLNKMIFYSSN